MGCPFSGHPREEDCLCRRVANQIVDVSPNRPLGRKKRASKSAPFPAFCWNIASELVAAIGTGRAGRCGRRVSRIIKLPGFAFITAWMKGLTLCTGDADARLLWLRTRFDCTDGHGYEFVG